MADPRATIIAAAQTRLGMPYRLDPPPDGVNNIDCSLYVLKTLADAGVPLQGVRTAEQIRQVTVPIAWDDVKAGDLLFFENTYDAGSPSADGHIASHIGISLGAGTKKMWDANSVHGVGLTDIGTPFWQEHIFEARRIPVLVDAAPAPPVSPADPWQWFSADAITRATGADLEHVLLYWPKIVAQLALAGINTRAAQIAALATIAVEVGNRFEPIHEYGTPANWAGYSGGARYAGRGFIQLTHDYNYRTYSTRLDELWGDGAPDLEANPDDALDPDVAAAVLALYFRERGIPAMAERGDWQAVRKAVNGGLTGWETFKGAVDRLSAVQPPVAPSTTPGLTRADIAPILAAVQALYDRAPV